MKTTKNIYQLSQNGIVKFLGSENDCYMKLQRVQGQSADYAMKYSGYKIILFAAAEPFVDWVNNSIDLEGYDMDNTASNLLQVSADEKAKNMASRAAFIDWLQGEPSTFASTTIFDENTKLFSELGIKTPDTATTTEEMEMLQGMIYDVLTLLSK